MHRLIVLKGVLTPQRRIFVMSKLVDVIITLAAFGLSGPMTTPAHPSTAAAAITHQA